MKKNILSIFIIFFIIIGLVIVGKFFSSKTQPTQQTQQSQGAKYWTCGMHPSVRVTDEEYKKGKTACPICNMPLIPVEAEEKPQTPGQPAPASVTGGPWISEEKIAEETYYGCGIKEEGHCPKCDEGKPDANCICQGHSFMLKAKKGMEVHCPICKAELKEIKPEEVEAVVQEENILSRVKLSKQQVELAGVVTIPIQKRHLIKEIKTVGKIAFDPELMIAQEEFLTAVETREKVKDSPDPDVIKRAQDLLDRSRFRLRLLGMGDSQIDELVAQKKAETNLVLPEDKVWVYAEVYEYELGWIKIDQEVKVATAAFPGEEFKGIIRSINPVLDPKTRSARVRLEIDNPDLKLKPEMFVDVKIQTIYVASDGSTEALALPKEAVLDTGLRKIVYVDIGEGKFLGKEVTLGPEANAELDGQTVSFYPVLKGLTGDEMIVTKGNFLIDSQSQLTGGMSVLWGGAQEIKTEGEAVEGQPVKSEPAAAPVETQHKH